MRTLSTLFGGKFGCHQIRLVIVFIITIIIIICVNQSNASINNSTRDVTISNNKVKNSDLLAFKMFDEREDEQLSQAAAATTITESLGRFQRQASSKGGRHRRKRNRMRKGYSPLNPNTEMGKAFKMLQPGPSMSLGYPHPHLLSPNGRGFCKTVPFQQWINVTGCAPKRIHNSYCYGSCNSFYVPSDNTMPAFTSCQFCTPRRFKPIVVELTCDSFVDDSRPIHMLNVGTTRLDDNRIGTSSSSHEISVLCIQASCNKPKDLLDDHCLRCLCAASSDCKPNARCRTIEPDIYVCGPFRINENYWINSGQMKLSSIRNSNPLDLQCSIMTVSNFIEPFIDRCNWYKLKHAAQCSLAAFVHYRAIYMSDDVNYMPDDDEKEEDDRDEKQRQSPFALNCDINSTNLVQMVDQLQTIAPATQSRRFNGATLGQLLEQATIATPNKTAFIVHHQEKLKTYAEFNRDVDQLAKSLLSIGCRRGDSIGIWAVNCYQWLLVQFATAKLGCLMVTVNPGYKENELIKCLNLVGLQTLICSQRFKTSNYCQILSNVFPELFLTTKGHRIHSTEIPSLRNLIFLDEEEDIAPPNMMRFSELMIKGMSDQSLDELIEESDRTQFDDVINVQFTSGTTGSPKGAMLTHHNIIQNVNFIGPRMFDGYQPNDDEQSPIICLPNPLYHCFGCVIGSTMNISLRGTMVIPSPVYSAKAALDSVEQYRCNYLYGTPTMWSDLLNVGVDQYNLANLKRGVMSGAPCPPALLHKIQSEIPSLENMFIPYGSTELSPVVTLTSIHDNFKRKTETVGQPIDYVEIKIIDPKTKRIVPRGEKGEVCVRGHCTFAGDIGFLDNDGYLSISGRIKEMIIRGGENIYPREVEDFILMHDLIEDAHVVGITDQRFGEEMVAYIKLKNGHQLTEDCIKTFLKPKISHLKIPKHIRFVEDFPRTATGKVQKVELKKLAEKQFNG
ncbi:hypothetical protein RDWZM_003030 [Blomia tropicalis]|uniref:Medium-chain acyl-CoA ligase ACSF2, mitochondrial n=1 Tax=Blomia tropicalis TaxID=40697 RepID=A0A9Q0RSA8_BLOTA|nr:hypothetical protein RDWZM_003030 [Blomia tropicalis]